MVIVQEAGGIVTEIEGGDDILTTGSVLAANPTLHAAMAEVLRNARVG